MKVRLLAVMAVVVVGVMAGTSPAMAQKAKTGSSKSQWTNQHKDNKVFGGAIHTLRKQVDSTNGALTTITVAALEALTQLKDGLTKVADATTEFKYGVVQVGWDRTAGTTLAGIGPEHFWVTPPIVKTGASSSVTFPIAASAAIGGTAGVKLLTAVRSVYPDKGAVVCRVTVATDTTPFKATGAANSGNELGGYYQSMPQSRIQPENGAETYPLALTPTEDNVVNLAASLNAFTALATTGMGTLTCLRTS